VIHLRSRKLTHTENTIWKTVLPAGKNGGHYHPRRRRAICLFIVRPRRAKCSVSGMRSMHSTKADQLGGAGRQAANRICPRAKCPLRAGNPYPFTSGAGSLLASKVGSFLASAEAQWRLDVIRRAVGRNFTYGFTVLRADTKVRHGQSPEEMGRCHRRRRVLFQGSLEFRIVECSPEVDSGFPHGIVHEYATAGDSLMQLSRNETRLTFHP